MEYAATVSKLISAEIAGPLPESIGSRVLDRLTIASLLVIATSFAWAAATLPILDNNEGMYARVAVEMADGGSWIVPTLNGTPYLEKPPLLYWITAASFRLFGVSELSARLAPLLAWFATVAGVHFFARRWWGSRSAHAAAMIAATSPLMVMLSCALMFDVLFTAALGWSVLLLWEALGRGGGARWMRLSATALAIAVMAKGLLALVLYLPLAAFLVFEGRGERAARARIAADPLAWTVFLAIAAPWHMAAAADRPGFAWFYFVNEHALRFLGLRQPADYYRGSGWYYVPRVAAAFAPWIVMAFVPGRTAATGDARLRRFLLVAIAIPLFFFTLSQAKANYYIIVALPFLALVLGRRLVRLHDSRGAVVAPLVVLAMLAWIAAGDTRGAIPGHAPRGSMIAWTAALVFSLLAVASFLRRKVTAGVAATSALALPFVLFATLYIGENSARHSRKDLVRAIEGAAAEGIFIYKDYEALSSVAFYRRDPLVVIDSESNDLWYGRKLSPDPSRYPTVQAFASQAVAGSLILVRRPRIGDFEARVGPDRVRRILDDGVVAVYRWRD